MTAVSRWFGCDPSAVAWRCWDDEVVVYADFSASVHVLGAQAGRIFLMLLQAGPAGLPPVDLYTDGSSVAPATDAEDITAALDALVELGLVKAPAA